MAAPDEREFVTYDRGVVRDQIILASMRNAMRALVDPATGLPFSEDDIARATQPGSRFYIEADAIDLYGQAMQQRAAFLADQIDPRRSTSAFLDDVHGRLWLGDDSRLPAVGASGVVLAKGSPGAEFVGSPTVPDAAATVGTDPNGKKFQVLATNVVGPDGTVELAVKGVDVGFATNDPPGTVIRWSANAPLSVEPTAVVISAVGEPAVGFSGGTDVETDQQYDGRIEDQIQSRPAAGNAAHFEAWARATAAVEQAFVYSCALHAGSVVVAVTQRRGNSAGPLARLPSVGVLSDVTSELVPPASPVVPERAYVLVVSPQAQPVDLVVRVAMNAGVGGGWFDANPWPVPPVPPDVTSVEQVQVTAVDPGQLQFDVATSLKLPANASSLSGADAPAIMLWDDATSRFERLLVDTITDLGGGTIRVTLLGKAVKTIAVGDRVSPYTDRLDAVAEALEQYFDSLGPGEVVPALDPRSGRAARKPRSTEKYPQRVGQSLASQLVDGLGGAVSDADLTRASASDPLVPANVADGPNMLTLGKVNLYPL